MATLMARPEALEIDFSQTALIIVDMQNAFASKGGLLDLFGIDISEAPNVVETNQRLIEACRTTGVKVIYLQMTYDPELENAGGPNSPNYHKELAMVLMRSRPELKGKLLVEGTWDWQVVPALTPRKGDRVIRKTRYSGFCRTDLADILRGDGIRNLLFTGIATNICVESTARDAYFEEFWPILVEDAMNHAGPDFSRQATLWNFENVFGWVTSSEAVMTALQAERTPDPVEP
jgi:ureidoacrylate peracid hydrolase